MGIQFKFELVAPEGRVHGLAMGHMTISTDAGSASSRARDQPMMIFLSLTLLLDGIRKLASGGTRFDFVGTDCSFEVLFKRNKKGSIVIEHARKRLGECAADPLVASLLRESSRFVASYRARFDRSGASSSAAFDDLDASMREFADAFGLEGKA